MTRMMLALSITALLGLAGCAGTSAMVQTSYNLKDNERVAIDLQAPESFDEEARAMFTTRLRNRLAANRMLASTSDKAPFRLAIDVVHYRMRHGATRFFAGAFAGADVMTSRVTIIDPDGGRTLAEFTVESTNPTAWGSAQGLIDEHADRVVRTIGGTAD